MAGVSPATLLHSWTKGREPYGERLASLLAADSKEPVEEDTLGQRNCRLLRLHSSLGGGPLEATVACPKCATQNEFVVPAEAVLATPAAKPDARVILKVGRRRLAFRLPRMKDLEGSREAIVERCRLEGEGAIGKAAIERLGRRFEALDPAANIVLRLNCSQCAAPIAASVDVATFVGRELDRLVDRLIGEIDIIASAYGWNESEILALPPRRRRLYADMILSRPRGMRSAGART